MKNKAVFLLLMLMGGVLLIGASANQAYALAEAGVGNAPWANPGAHAWTNCNNGNPCAFHDAGQTPPNRAAFCMSQNAAGTSVEADAKTWGVANGWVLRVKVDGLVRPGDWMWGKGGQSRAVDISITDSIRVEIDTTYHGPGPGYDRYIVRKVVGYIEVYPKNWVDSWLDFELKAGDSSDPERIFHNHGFYSIGGFSIEGNPPVGFTDNSTTSTLIISISDVDTIHCDVAYEELSFWLKKGERATNVPTLTQWGTILLVALLACSAILVMLKRRKAAVIA